jgi:cell wall-associated NlpC family hydrolase
LRITRFLTLATAALLLAAPVLAQSHGERYAIALSPTPVLSTPDFAAVFGGRDRKTLHTDSCGLVREMEFIALPGTVFHIEDALERDGHRIFRVTTTDYPYPTATGYFIDSRFVTTTATEPPSRHRSLPTEEAIIARLLSAEGRRYIWGGNVRGGVPELIRFYPPTTGAKLDPATRERWELKGLDCSGLLYEATDGFTPRNTSALVTYGRGLPISGLTAAEIIQRVKPLDLITWSGHVLIILDRQLVIESRLDCKGRGGGVRVRPLAEALDEIMKTRTPLNDYAAGEKGKRGFVIRRWYPDAQATPGRAASTRQ